MGRKAYPSGIIALPLARWGLLLGAWLFLVSALRFELYALMSLSSPESTPPPSDFYSLEAAVLDNGLAPSLHPPLFTCPDGRTGLHVVHTRFLLGQSHVNTTFVASRLLLLSTFFVTSLNAQTVSSFIVVASYDARLAPSVIEALHSELKRLKVPVVMHRREWKEIGRADNEHMLSQSSMVPLLRDAGVLPEDAPDLNVYITSRMDTDDAVHIEAAGAVQKLSCASPDKPKWALQVAYMRAGLLWEPSEDSSTAVYGLVARPDPEPKYLAIMQSMITARGMQNCSMNVYSHKHMEPYLLSNMSQTMPECPFIFRQRRNLHIWEPPPGQFGSLYVRTATSSTRDKNKTALEAWEPATMDVMRESFGLEESSLVLTNMFFSGLEAEALDLLRAKNPGKWKRL